MNPGKHNRKDMKGAIVVRKDQRSSRIMITSFNIKILVRTMSEKVNKGLQEVFTKLMNSSLEVESI